MFYFLSKVLFYVLMPLSITLLILVWAVFTKNIKRKNKLLKIGIIMVFVFGNDFLVNEGFLLWEIPPTSPESITEPYDVGIVLTGGMISNKEGTPQEIFVDKTADRFIQPLRLYKQGKIKKILITGGNTDLTVIRNDVSDENLKTAQLLEELGVKKSDLILETKARNTRENAIYTAEILQKNPQLGTKYLLFTSAFHQRRSIGCFEKARLTVTPFSTAFKSKARTFTFNSLIIPSEAGYYEGYHLIHEILGYCVYKVLGYC
ncbi:YdcF family protein [Arcicella lustrica]|uniref:YdcF family protein n=1 Tax=Arcicella lustrica TaxID=2984196 RepID=A0ABU5SMM6_9BACT|nr:YdcF family protein [Arcicella sp. DC25W]MEA5428527.1 YdcF family protein [Arcicella sp. DC25W]